MIGDIAAHLPYDDFGTVGLCGLVAYLVWSGKLVPWKQHKSTREDLRESLTLNRELAATVARLTAGQEVSNRLLDEIRAMAAEGSGP